MSAPTPEAVREARKRGLESEVAVNPTGPALLEALRSLNTTRQP